MAGKKNFGFETHTGRQIDLDRTGNSLATELSEAIKAWNSCISCGSCTATCPAGLNFRKLHYQIRLSLKLSTPERTTVANPTTVLSAQVLTTLNCLAPEVSKEAVGMHPLELPTLNCLAPEVSKEAVGMHPLELATLSTCFLCGKCQLVCPRGITTRYLAIQIMQKTRQYAEGIPSV